jgi:hypothetical protein
MLVEIWTAKAILSNEVSDGKWVKNTLGYIIAKNLAAFVHSLGLCGKQNLRMAKLGYLIQEIPKQQKIQTTAWLLLITCSEMQRVKKFFKARIYN